MHTIHLFHILPFAVLAAVLAVGFIEREYIKKALTENGSPSSFRINGTLVNIVILFCEIYHTVKAGVFDKQHLQTLCVYALVLLGLIKAAQIFSYLTRQPAPPEPKDTPPATKQDNI